jgi:CheY-like chemotaxis protein/two-component sensor histidine kinase
MQPLEAARLFTSALAEQTTLTSVQQRQVDNIDKSLKAANDLLTDLSEMARLESGNIQVNKQAFALNDLFDELAQEFTALAIEQSVEFRLVASSVWINSDRQLLRRIIQNLVGNAFRYASPGKVLLGARVFKQEVIIQVLDNGPGIPADKQSAVFEQFTQLNMSNNTHGKGLGLGLNISQSLVQLLGHRLSLESKVMQGCKFSVHVEQALPSQVSADSALPSFNVALKDITVLCIDNDPDVLSGMVELLSAWQCNILAADSRASALAEFANHHNTIDILLVDYQLGYAQNHQQGKQDDGLTLIKDIRHQYNQNLPAILITAATEAGLEQKAKSDNVGYMAKLVKPAALRALMSAMLAKKLQVDYLGYSE